jgi:hypothetical protein
LAAYLQRADGLTLPRAHGNTDRPPHNITSPAKLDALSGFLIKLADAEGVPNPRFAFERTSEDGPDILETIVHLPPRFTLGSLYIKYKEHLSDYVELVVGRRTFDHLFKELPQLQHIKLSQRSRGVCELCKDLRLTLSRCQSDARLASVMEGLRIHLQAAYTQRSLYQERTARSVEAWRSPRARLPVGMISFDYASKLKCPSSTMQSQGEYMGEEFGLDVFLFGICNEGEKTYYNYFYPEGFNSGDSDTVISMTHHHLTADRRLFNCKKLYVYTDSCSGQNRNCYVYSYFINRIVAGLHEEISWNFMVVGHTKFSPDRGFGLIRQSLEKFDAFTIPDLVAMANTLAPSSEYACRGAPARTDKFRRYKTSIADPFVKLKGIKALNIGEIIFRPAEKDGKRICCVSYKLVGSSDDEVQVQVVKRGRTAEERANTHERFPNGEILSSSPPPVIERKVFSYDRWAQLMEILDRCVGVTEDVLDYYRAIPHRPYTSRCSRKERGDGAVGAVLLDIAASSSSTSSGDEISIQAEPPEEDRVLPEKRARTSGEIERRDMIATASEHVPRFMRDLPTTRRQRRQHSLD